MNSNNKIDTNVYDPFVEEERQAFLGVFKSNKHESSKKDEEVIKGTVLRRIIRS